MTADAMRMQEEIDELRAKLEALERQEPVEIDRVVNRLESSDPDFTDCEDAVALLRKYRKLCEEVGRGDSYHLNRIEKAAVAVESRAAGAVGQGPALKIVTDDRIDELYEGLEHKAPVYLVRACIKEFCLINNIAAGAVEQPVQKLSFDDALRIARGCTDYGGGYRGGDKFEAYQHGIGTVINALTSASLNGLEDYQVRTLHAMGAKQHASDCAVHNEPAYPAGPCDCDVAPLSMSMFANTADYEAAVRDAIVGGTGILQDGKRVDPQAMRQDSQAPSVYYMRDNHTFRRLSNDVETAVAMLWEEFDDGYTCGMLCSKTPGTPKSVQSNGRDKWAEFEAAARAYYAALGNCGATNKEAP